ncbi:hypothetical protein MKW98_008169 [Papaver atlanticum]|uniref:J domain-containing protein n=1 Tax=Papaver atlanticum TaxID=357466 RepID=A0AAD4X3M3_9MAGN|nr:hypothetical protein MKW98_008169 [Papaver atlanticum]
MADQHNSASTDFHNILGLAKGSSIKDVCKAYKSLVMRWHPDRYSSSNKVEAESKYKTINEAYEAIKDKKLVDDNINGVLDSDSIRGGSVRSRSRREDPTTPKGSFFRHLRADSNGGSPTSLSKSSSRRSHTPQPCRPKSLLKSLSRRSTTPTPSSNRADSLSKSMSRRSASTTPIMFSCSSERAKLPPVEKTLECTLEELCHGCVKKIEVTRDLLKDNGVMVQEEEVLRIKVKPGWKKGTKITFDGMGNEKPGTLTADIIFVIDEKRHPVFKREGDDLILKMEISLVKALTGCTLPIPLLGGEKMSISFTDVVIYPGYEKIIQGQGMPTTKDPTRRGDLRIKFHIIFPTDLTQEQRSDIFNLLNESS